MADFTSGFWSLFISLTTIASLVFLLVFLLLYSKKKAGDETQKMDHIWDGDLQEMNTPLPRWWLYAFVITLAWGAAYLVLYPGLGSYSGVLNWSSKGQFDQEMQYADDTYGPVFEQFVNTELATLVNDEAALKIGESLYASYCTTCHGSDARGARGYPNLRDDDWLYGGDFAAIKKTLTDGRQAAMPAWGQILKEEEVFNVVSYVEQLAGRVVDDVSASSGKAVYNTNCAMCHGADGKGNYMFGAPNLTDDIWLYGGSQKKITESVVKGRAGMMPAHKEFLGEAKIHILTAYIYSLSN